MSAVSDLPGGRPHLRRSLIVLLVVANATWGGLCVLTAAALTGTASMFGLTHLVGEGVFVGGLAALEWSQREQLRIARLTSAST